MTYYFSKVTFPTKLKGMTFDYDFECSFPLFSSLLKKREEEKYNQLAKIVIKSHAFQPVADQTERYDFRPRLWIFFNELAKLVIKSHALQLGLLSPPLFVLIEEKWSNSEKERLSSTFSKILIHFVKLGLRVWKISIIFFFQIWLCHKNK